MVSVGKRLRLDHLAEPHIEFPFDHAELALDDIGINVLGLYPVEVTTRCDIAWFGLEAPPLLHVADEQLAVLRPRLGEVLQVELRNEMMIAGTPAID